VEDVFGEKDSIMLTGIDQVERYYEFDPTAALDEVDLSQIRHIIFVVNENNVTVPEGSLGISLGGYPFTPLVPPDPAVSAEDITRFPEILGSSVFASTGDPFGGEPIINRVQLSESLQRLEYSNLHGDGYAALLTSFGYDDDPGDYPTSVDLSGMESIVLGLRLSSDWGTITMEMEDVHGNKDVVRLAEVSTTEQFYNLYMGFFKTVDLTQVKSFNIVLNGGDVPEQGTLEVRLGDYAYTPEYDPDPSLTLADVPELSLSATTFISSVDGTIFLQDGFRARQGSDIGGLHFSEAVNVLNDDDQVRIGIQTYATDVTLEIADLDGNLEKVVLHTSGSGEFEVFSISASDFPGVDLTNIGAIIISSESGELSHDVTVYLPHHFPVVTSDSSLTTADITPFPDDHFFLMFAQMTDRGISMEFSNIEPGFDFGGSVLRS